MGCVDAGSAIIGAIARFEAGASESPPVSNLIPLQRHSHVPT